MRNRYYKIYIIEMYINFDSHSIIKKRKKKKKLYISTTIIESKHQNISRRNTVLSFTNVVCIKIDTLTINPLSIYPILAGLSRAQSATSGYTGWRDFNGKSEFTKRESCGPSPSHGIYVRAVMQLDAPLLSRQRFRSL